jgi:hypothetical protein
VGAGVEVLADGDVRVQGSGTRPQSPCDPPARSPAAWAGK